MLRNGDKYILFVFLEATFWEIGIKICLANFEKIGIFYLRSNESYPKFRIIIKIILRCTKQTNLILKKKKEEKKE